MLFGYTTVLFLSAKISSEQLALKLIIHFAAAAAADSNHEQEWALIKSGKGRDEKRREEEPQFATGAHFLSGTKGRNYEAVRHPPSSVCCLSGVCVATRKSSFGEESTEIVIKGVYLSRNL